MMESEKEKLMRKIFSICRSRGHLCVELRKAGRNWILFCAVCLAPCHGDTCLYDHLNGKRHNKRLAYLRENSWPLRDDVFFFNVDLDIHRVESVDSTQSEDNRNPGDNGTGQSRVIPAVLQKDGIADLVVRKIGIGKFCARLHEKDGIFSEIHRMWCDWLGNVEMPDENIEQHEFAVVTFSYIHELGRNLSDRQLRNLRPSIAHSEAEDHSRSTVKKTTYSSRVNCPDDSSRKEPQSSSNSKSKEATYENEDQLIQFHVHLLKASNNKSEFEKWCKAMRKQFKKIECRRTCGICLQKLLQYKDVAALLNRSTGKLVCSSRNPNGIFHMFHVSCLIQWILLSEVEIFEKQSVEPKGEEKSKTKVEDNGLRSTYCPDCHGSGIKDFENALKTPESEIWKRKIKLLDARKAWIRSPENLENCPLGLAFPSHNWKMDQEDVATLKYLSFYRAHHY